MNVGVQARNGLCQSGGDAAHASPRRPRAPSCSPGLARGRVAPAAARRRARRSGVSVVIPARDEAARIGPCLAGLADDPGVLEVDRGRRRLQRRAPRPSPARRRAGRGRPSRRRVGGQAVGAAAGARGGRGDVVVSLDADTRPRPGLIGALAAALRDADFVTAGARFACTRAGERCCTRRCWPRSSTASGPPTRPAPGRARGQRPGDGGGRRGCSTPAATRPRGAHDRRRGARARAAARGWRVAFVTAPSWSTWHVRVGGRDLARMGPLDRARRRHPAGVAGGRPRRRLARPWRCRVPRPRRAADAGSTSRCSRCALALLPALAGCARRGAAFWLSPLADPAPRALTLSAVRPARTWRGRTYPGDQEQQRRSAS